MTQTNPTIYPEPDDITYAAKIDRNDYAEVMIKKWRVNCHRGDDPKKVLTPIERRCIALDKMVKKDYKKNPDIFEANRDLVEARVERDMFFEENGEIKKENQLLKDQLSELEAFICKEYATDQFGDLVRTPGPVFLHHLNMIQQIKEKYEKVH